MIDLSYINPYMVIKELEMKVERLEEENEELRKLIPVKEVEDGDSMD